MKRKAETTHQIEAKIPSLSSFIKEENLNVDEIETDVSKFIEYYNEFLNHISDAFDKKEKANPIKIASIIIKFKELNRKAQFRLNISRDKTKETKDAINKNHLAMQNLLYEALHLEKETNSCLEFKSLHEDIDLVAMEEFMQMADDNLKNYTNEHEMTLNRLYWELNQRKNLSAQITSAEEMEKQLQIEISKKRQAYNEISSHLKSVFDTTKPLENIFDLPMHHQDEQNGLVERLAEPLYVLYLQMRIQADLDKRDTSVELVSESGSVHVAVRLTLDPALLVLVFRWDHNLELVTVHPSLESVPNGVESASQLSRCLLEPFCLLSELPGDSGSPLRSPWARSKLERSSSSLCPGIPYLWCQRLSGTFTDHPAVVLQDHRDRNSSGTSGILPIEYSSLASGSVDTDSGSSKRVYSSRPLARLMTDIRDRVKARLQLTADLNSLSPGTAGIRPPSQCCPAVSSLTGWTVSNFSQLSKSPESTPFVTCGLANEQCFVFTALIRSPRYTDDEIPIWITIPHSYPLKNPIIILSKSGKLPTQNQMGSLALVIHLLEVEVNCFCDEFPDDVFCRQINRLLLGVDILLDYLHGGCVDNKINQILIGNKYPVSRRPFKSN